MTDHPKDAGRTDTRAGDLAARLAELREVVPPPSLVPQVMRRIADPAPKSFWSWLLAPRRLELRLRLSPLGALAAASLGTLGLVVLLGSWSVPRGRSTVVVEVPSAAPVAASSAGSPDGAVVVVRFSLVAEGARTVKVAGDFNGWDPDRSPMVKQDANGTFVGTVRLPPGAHEYMFVVDGKWITDPAAAERRPDGFGRTNAVLRL